MAKVETWFRGFAFQHTERIPRPDWPPAESEFWISWRRAFVKHGLILDVADAASFAVAEDPPPHIDRHLPAILVQAKRIWAEARATAAPVVQRFGPVPMTEPERDAARASATCPECGGTGWAKRRGQWHEIAKPYLLDLFCRCPLGRFRKEFDPELAKPGGVRLHDDLQSRPDLWRPDLSHPTWDIYPCRHNLNLPGEGETSWYLDPSTAPVHPVKPQPVTSLIPFTPWPSPDRDDPPLSAF